MPIFEYVCNNCGREFEVLKLSDNRTECLFCHSTALIKRFSRFAVQSGSSFGKPKCASDCRGGFEKGACGSGMCGEH